MRDYITERCLDLRHFIDQHFSLFLDPDTHAFHALFLHIPGTSVEIYTEWRTDYSAWDIERDGPTTQIWLGRLETTICTGHKSKASEAA